MKVLRFQLNIFSAFAFNIKDLYINASIKRLRRDSVYVPDIIISFYFAYVLDLTGF